MLLCVYIMYNLITGFIYLCIHAILKSKTHALFLNLNNVFFLFLMLFYFKHMNILRTEVPSLYNNHIRSIKYGSFLS